MMRGKSSSSMQKTYDECYLTCSTAVYFEGQVHSPPSSPDKLKTDYALRTMKLKHCAHGAPHWTALPTIVLTGSRLTTGPSQKQRRRYLTP